MKCPDCGGNMEMRRGRFGYFLGCARYPKCKGAHGVHQKTRKPLGKPADKATREARIEAHAAFDGFWSSRGWDRTAGYCWLADKMGMRVDDCHIGQFDKEQCNIVIGLVALEDKVENGVVVET